MSGWLEIPRGLLGLVWYRNKIWTADLADTMKGRRKWKVKNRVKVALSTANPPQIHFTRSFPIYGITENKLVITVAPQKDI